MLGCEPPRVLVVGPAESTDRKATSAWGLVLLMTVLNFETDAQVEAEIRSHLGPKEKLFKYAKPGPHWRVEVRAGSFTLCVATATTLRGLRAEMRRLRGGEDVNTR